MMDFYSDKGKGVYAEIISIYHLYKQDKRGQDKPVFWLFGEKLYD